MLRLSSWLDSMIFRVFPNLSDSVTACQHTRACTIYHAQTRSHTHTCSCCHAHAHACVPLCIIHAGMPTRCTPAMHKGTWTQAVGGIFLLHQHAHRRVTCINAHTGMNICPPASAHGQWCMHACPLHVYALCTQSYAHTCTPLPAAHTAAGRRPVVCIDAPVLASPA